MAIAVTPIAGFDTEAVHLGTSVFVAPFNVGTRITADDGHDYIYSRASAVIAASTVSVLTEPDLTMAAGAGDWTSPAHDLAAGDSAWFKKTAI